MQKNIARFEELKQAFNSERDRMILVLQKMASTGKETKMT